jgi:uncharacterized alpha-E superfamily protein
MLCRVAEQIFWTSRYVERAIAVSRLLDVTLHLELDAGDDETLDLWQPLLGAGVADDGAWSPTAVRRYLAFDLNNPTSVASCIRLARTAARGIRESISSEMWEQLNSLFLFLSEPDLQEHAEDDPHRVYKRVREGAQTFQGLAESTLAHGEDWQFLRLGMFLERATNVARVLTLQGHLLTPDTDMSRTDETVRWLAVLRSCGSAEAYARYYSLRVEPARVIEFLLLNALFPQSVRFSLNAAWDALSEIANDEPAGEVNSAVRAMGRVRAIVEHSAVDEVLEAGLGATLDVVQRRIADVADHVTRIYLRDQVEREQLMPASRAALIMAAQQQQQQ